MTIEVEIQGTGQIIEFPDGTTPEVIQNALASFRTQQAQQPVEQATTEQQANTDTTLVQDVDNALANIPGAIPLAEFAAGVNRSVLGALDFIGPDNINAILELGGSDRRVPTFTESFGAQPESFVEGLPGRALGTAGELAAVGAGAGQILRGAAQTLSPLAAASEGAGAGVLRQLGKVGVGADIAGGAAAGAGEEIGRELGGETGAMIGGFAAPFATAPLQAILSGAKQAVTGDIPQTAKQVIREGERRGVDVLTSDVLPPETFAAKSLQQLGEKLGPIFGTGAARAKQQTARQGVIEDIAQEFGVSLDSPLEANIIKNLEKGIAERLAKASEIRNEAVDSLVRFGDVPVENTVAAIDKQIARQARLRGEADPAIIDKLTSLKESIQNADFSLVKDFRSNLIDDISAALKGEALPTKASAPLQSVKSAIDKDLLSFAKSNDRSAAAKWIQSNRLFADNLRKAKETELKRLLTKGTDSPENVANIIKGGRLSELNRLNRFIGPKGRKSAKAAIIRDALSESGFFGGNINPDRFINAMQKPARQKAVKAFFGDQGKKEVDGLIRLLDATRRAQQAGVSTPTGQQLVPLAVGGGAVADPLTTFLLSGSLSAAAKGYESKTVRNALLRLSNTKKGSKQESRLADKLIPSLLGALESTSSQEQQTTQDNP